jgi:hypothetical protein
MAKFTDKISNLINSQAPDFVLEQHPKFLEFIKTYYTFMESAELVVTSVQTTDGIQLETETAQTNALLLDGSRIDSDRTQLDTGDKIILESSAFGKFTRGETITGQTSNATATVLGEDLDNGRLFISAQDKFVEGEIVLGASSNASAVINNYRPNPVNNIQDLLNFRDPDKVISNFLTKFRNEFLNTLPETLNSGVNKRTLIKNVKSLYRAKGTARAHEVFFRLLFGLQSETIYPREQMLRVSDGKWTTNKILRTIQTSAQLLSGDPADLIGRTITGETSSATAIVENVFKFQIGPYQVVEFIINDDTVTGTFQTDEIIRGTATDDDDIFIKSTVTGIPSIITISNDGSNYSTTDSISITGGGTGSIIQVDGVGRGGITEFIIDDGGSGYEIGDDLVFTNTNTGGGNASAKVAVVNGGFTQEESTSSVDDHIVLEDETVRGDIYTGNKVVQESGTGSGDITDIRIITSGSNYITLPSVVVDDTNGSGASVFAYGSEIGRVQSLKIVESGAEYQQSPTPPTLTLPTYLLIADKSGDFVVGETVTGLDSSSTVVTATVVSYSSSTGILKCSGTSGTFAEETVITGDGGATATIKKADQATATVTVDATADTAGTYINEDGHVSENTMRIQDSLYYQDFSYVIKVGRTINDWRDSFKKTLHTAGFYFTGQVNLETQVSAQITSPVEGIISGIEESPIFGIISTLFSTIFGRRLGTEDDGTTLRATPEIGVNPDFDATSTPDLFTSNTRDVTLTRKMKISFPSIVKQTVRGTEYKFGHAYAGPRMKTLDIYDNPFGTNNMFSGTHTNARTTAFTASGPGSTTMITPLKMINWADHTIIGLNNSLNGTGVQIDDYNNDNLKTYITWPSEIRATLPGFTFDRTGTTFDTTSFTFDKTF